MAVPLGFCQATLIVPSPNTPIDCAGNASGIVTSVSPFLYYNVNTLMGNIPFNPGIFTVKVGDSICVDGTGEAVSTVPCDIMSQFLIGDEPMTVPFAGAITNLFPGCPFIPAPLLQEFANNAAVEGVTIEVSFSAGVFTIVITKRSSIRLSSLAKLVVMAGEERFLVAEAPFICNLRRIGGVSGGTVMKCPDEILFKSPTSPPRVEYCNQQYKFYGVDGEGWLHYVNIFSNIEYRTTRNWTTQTVENVNF